MVVLTPIERETLQVFLLISQMLNVSTFGNTADIYAIAYLVPHACQHITVDQSHSRTIWLLKSGDYRGVDAQRQCVLHKHLEEKVARG